MTDRRATVTFGRFQLDTAGERLWRGNQAILLKPKALSVLRYLAEHPDRLVIKAELLDAVWPDVAVSDAVLKVCIAELRKALGDDARAPKFIETVHRRGYRFIAAVTTQDTAPHPDRAREASAAHRPPAVPFVGRREELAFLMDAFRSAAAGAGGMVSVSGEAGLGKTTLVDRFLRLLRADLPDLHIGRGRSFERLAGTDGYAPVVEALESLIADAGAPGLMERVRAAAPLWSRLLERAGAPEVPATSGFDQRLRMELRKLLDQLSCERPVILFFDDWHWTDPSTVDVLSDLARRLDRARVLLIVAYRSSELLLDDHRFARVKRDLESQGMLKDLPLDLLDLHATRDYLNFTFSGHAFPSEFFSFMHARTQGHPLFLVDLAEYMRGSGMIECEDRRWVLKQHPAEQSLPRSVHGLIGRKLGFLAEADLAMLAAAGVQGSEFESAIVAETVGKTGPEVEESLAALADQHRLLRGLDAHVLPDETPSRRFAFAHVLYQDAAFSTLSAEQKSRWSRATAEALLRAHGGRADHLASQIAYLLEQAHEPDRAADHYAKAADIASRTAAYDEAITLAKRGLALCERQAGSAEADERCAKLLVALAETHLHLRTADGMAASIDYARRATDLQPHSARAHALLAQAHVLRASHVLAPPDEDIPEACDAALRAIELDGRLPLAHTALGYVRLLGDWDWSGSRAAFDRALASDADYAPAHLGRAFSFIALGQPDRALESTERAMALDPYSLIIRAQLGWMLYFCRRYHEAAAHLTATADRDPRFWRPYLNLGFCYLASRRFDDAVRVLERAALLNPNALTNAVLAQAYAFAGEREKAHRILEFVRQTGYASAYWTALVHAALGDVETALQYLERSVRERECVLFVVASEPALDALRQDPRGEALLGRVGSRSTPRALTQNLPLA